MISKNKLANKDFFFDNGLNRLEKGFYLGEQTVWYILDYFGIGYFSNPKQYQEWLKHTNTDFDLIVEKDGKSYFIEVKYTSKPIFHSWFMRDWYSRECDIIVTTSTKNHVPIEDRRLLKFKGVRLFNMSDFVYWLLDINVDSSLVYDGNKLCLNGLFVVSELVVDSMTFNDIGHVNELIPTIRLRHN